MVAGEVQQLHLGKHALLRRITVPLALLSLARVTTYCTWVGGDGRQKEIQALTDLLLFSITSAVLLRLYHFNANW